MNTHKRKQGILFSLVASIVLSLAPIGCIDLPANTGYEYVVITTEHTANHSLQLDAFVTHKRNRGVRVHVETVESIEATYPDGERADKIRKWLQEHYQNWGIRFVLLIGSPDPYNPVLAAIEPLKEKVGTLPMKMTWPNGNDCPTDYYYADLTGNWDLDEDGLYGEFEELTDDGVDLEPEVLVGRIPSDNVDTIDSILCKFMLYDNDSDLPVSESQEATTTWRRNILLANSWPMPNIDGSYLGKAIQTVALEEGYPCTTLYQQENVSTGNSDIAANSFFESDIDLVEGAVATQWSSRHFGLVGLSGHGNDLAMKIGNRGTGWSGDMLHVDEVGSLDDRHPSFVILGACSTAKPETENNLAHGLMANGSIATIAATRVTSGGPVSSYVNSNTPAGFVYGISERMIQDRVSFGAALYDFKRGLSCPRGAQLQNLFAFNLYGDPAMRLRVP
ncbi:MAG: C25 family cysteine peptidase [Planctomycetota bacterium]|jgi:hypothetical protein|nr:C25 family cysteine peptidase [Planctomycetota bacterium]